MTSILRRPTIPEALKEAAARRTLIPFVGAGASKLAGCPGWIEFADGALRTLADSGHLGYGQLEQLKDLGPRVKLSIARAVERQTGTTIDFKDLLHRTLLEKHPDGNRLYSAILSVHDDGPGIAAEDQERIFEQFERATESNVQPGMGLGLWLARRIVTAHGGTVTVDSVPGSGATFNVVLPMGDQISRTAGDTLSAHK